MTTPSTTRSEELKPCPFCGGEGSLRGPHGPLLAAVHCIDCEARGPLAARPSTAIAEWNQRTPSPDDALREALEEVESVARLFASFYLEASDGRNTFVIFTDKIDAALASTRSEEHL